MPANVSGFDICIMFAIVLGLMIATEIIGHHYIYKHENYQDLIVKTKNLGQRLKKLKYDYMYVPSTKKKQEQKMIKV